MLSINCKKASGETISNTKRPTTARPAIIFITFPIIV